jgi:hypothetical protein
MSTTSSMEHEQMMACTNEPSTNARNTAEEWLCTGERTRATTKGKTQSQLEKRSRQGGEGDSSGKRLRQNNKAPRAGKAAAGKAILQFVELCREMKSSQKDGRTPTHRIQLCPAAAVDASAHTGEKKELAIHVPPEQLVEFGKAFDKVLSVITALEKQNIVHEYKLHVYELDGEQSCFLFGEVERTMVEPPLDCLWEMLQAELNSTLESVTGEKVGVVLLDRTAVAGRYYWFTKHNLVNRATRDELIAWMQAWFLENRPTWGIHFHKDVYERGLPMPGFRGRKAKTCTHLAANARRLIHRYASDDTPRSVLEYSMVQSIGEQDTNDHDHDYEHEQQHPQQAAVLLSTTARPSEVQCVASSTGVQVPHHVLADVDDQHLLGGVAQLIYVARKLSPLEWVRQVELGLSWLAEKATTETRLTATRTCQCLVCPEEQDELRMAMHCAVAWDRFGVLTVVDHASHQKHGVCAFGVDWLLMLSAGGAEHEPRRLRWYHFSVDSALQMRHTVLEQWFCKDPCRQLLVVESFTMPWMYP